MKVVATLELELEIPETEDIDKAVEIFLNKSKKVPVGLLFGHMNICQIRRVEPWETSLPKF